VSDDGVQETANALHKMQYLIDTENFMDDPNFTDAINTVLSLLEGKTLPNHAAALEAMHKLSQYAALMKIGYVSYMTFNKNKPDAANKKNIYRSAYDAIDKVVDNLKYLVKN